MNSGESVAEPQGSDAARSVRRHAREHRDLDEIFGDDLPSVTRDDRDVTHTDDGGAWYADERPPHYL